jgi:hypothetical protein
MTIPVWTGAVRTGLVDRVKGVIKVDDVYVGPATASERAVFAMSTSVVNPNYGLLSVSTFSTAAGNPTLGTPFAGAFVTIYSTAATTGFKIQASSSGQVGFGSTNFMVCLGTSTSGIVSASQSFIGASSSQWIPVGGGFGAAIFTTA